MNINDKRSSYKDIQWSDLVEGEVYVSQRFQKYMIFTQESNMVDLDCGEEYDVTNFDGDSFTHVKARLEIE